MVTDCVQIIELNRPIAKKEDTHWPFASMTENNVQTLRLTALKFKAMIFGVRCDTIIYFKIGKQLHKSLAGLRIKMLLHDDKKYTAKCGKPLQHVHRFLKRQMKREERERKIVHCISVKCVWKCRSCDAAYEIVYFMQSSFLYLLIYSSLTLFSYEYLLFCFSFSLLVYCLPIICPLRPSNCGIIFEIFISHYNCAFIPFFVYPFLSRLFDQLSVRSIV